MYLATMIAIRYVKFKFLRNLIYEWKIMSEMGP